MTDLSVRSDSPAGEPAAFSETFHPAQDFPEARTFLSTARLVVIFGCGAALICLLAWLAGFELRDAFVFVALPTVPLLAAALVSRGALWIQAFPRTVQYRDGTIFYSSPKARISVPVDRCHWFEGSVHDDTDLRLVGLRRRCLIIVFPNGRRAACGHTDAHREQWIRLLDRHSPPVFRPTGAKGTGVVLLRLAGLGAGLTIGAVVGRTLVALLPGNSWPIPLGVALGGMLGAIGFLLPLRIPGSAGGTSQERVEIAATSVGFPILIGICGSQIGGFSWPPGILFSLIGTALSSWYGWSILSSPPFSSATGDGPRAGSSKVTDSIPSPTRLAGGEPDDLPGCHHHSDV